MLTWTVWEPDGHPSATAFQSSRKTLVPQQLLRRLAEGSGEVSDHQLCGFFLAYPSWEGEFWPLTGLMSAWTPTPDLSLGKAAGVSQNAD